MLRGKVISVPVGEVVKDREKVKAYAMRVNGTTEGYTKIRLRCPIWARFGPWPGAAIWVR